MLDIHKDVSSPCKVEFTHSLLPSYIDPQNVSTKKFPFHTFHAHHFSHTLDLVLPSEVYELVRARLEDEDVYACTRALYARAYLTLEDLLTGDFFTEYIKKGNIMMRSEGRTNVDNILSLYEGKLRIELDRPTYERCGLQGTPVEDGGRKHQKNRWVVELNLREPSMLPGKKGFSRLQWAAKNVLNNSLTWLFYNLIPSSRESLPDGKEPISIHHPFIHTISPVTTSMPKALAPNLKIGDLKMLYDPELPMALLEYIHMVSLSAPRINSDDHIDSFLSRYEVPDLGSGLEEEGMVKVQWRGFISPQFIQDLFIDLRKHGLKIEKADHDGEGGTTKEDEKRWFALSAKGFDSEGYTIMQWAGRETLCWEML